MTPVILEKLPNEVKLIIRRKLDKEVWELSDLLHIIKMNFRQGKDAVL